MLPLTEKHAGAHGTNTSTSRNTSTSSIFGNSNGGGWNAGGVRAHGLMLLVLGFVMGVLTSNLWYVALTRIGEAHQQAGKSETAAPPPRNSVDFGRFVEASERKTLTTYTSEVRRSWSSSLSSLSSASASASSRNEHARMVSNGDDDDEEDEDDDDNDNDNDEHLTAFERSSHTNSNASSKKNDSAAAVYEVPAAALPAVLATAGGEDATQSVRLVMGVLSAVGNQERRQAVRQTWFKYAGGAAGTSGRARMDASASSSSNGHEPTWAGVFIVGFPPKRHEAALRAEMEEYGDIIIAQVADTYQSLTLKVLALLRFASDHFPGAYVLKTDDDTFVAADRALDVLDAAPPGCFYLGAQQKLNEQLTWDPNNKWYVPPDEFPFGQNVLYMQGGAYVLSADLARGVADMAAQPDFTLPFPSAGFLEDASIGVLLAQNGMQWTCRHSDFRFSGRRPYGNGYCTNDGLVTYHHVDAATMRKMDHAYVAAGGGGSGGSGNESESDPSTSADPSTDTESLSLCEVVEAANMQEMDLLGDVTVISDASGPLVFADGLRNLVGAAASSAAGAPLRTAANQNQEGGDAVHADGSVTGGDVNDDNGSAKGMDVHAAAAIRLDALRQESAISAGLRTRVQPGRSHITAFTMVAIEAGSVQERRLVEWIDFHMIQGVDRFVLYDNSGGHRHDGDGGGQLEALLFEYMDVGVVEVIRWPQARSDDEIVRRRLFADEADREAFEFIVSKCEAGIDEDVWYTPQGETNPRYGDRFPYECQLAAYMDAFAAYRGSSDWMIPFDMDEYVYAPLDATLYHYLRTLPALVTAWQVQCSSFGSSGVVTADDEKLLIETHTHRAPYIRFGEDEEAIRDAKPGCAETIPGGSEWPVCETGPGKTIIRGAAVKPSKANIHDTLPLFGDKMGGGTSSMDILCNHYVFPSKDEVRKGHCLSCVHSACDFCC